MSYGIRITPLEGKKPTLKIKNCRIELTDDFESPTWIELGDFGDTKGYITECELFGPQENPGKPK